MNYDKKQLTRNEALTQIVRAKSGPKPGHETAAQLHAVYAAKIDKVQERRDERRAAKEERKRLRRERAA